MKSRGWDRVIVGRKTSSSHTLNCGVPRYSLIAFIFDYLFTIGEGKESVWLRFRVRYTEDSFRLVRGQWVLLLVKSLYRNMFKGKDR